MIILSKDTQDLIYKALNALEKTPKVEDVDEGLKELIRYELHSKQLSDYYTYGSTYMWNESRNQINITDRLVNSYIGVILKRIRVERRKTAFLNKRIPSRANMNTVMSYYNMSEWEYVKCGSSKCISSSSKYRSTIDRMKRDFTRAIIDFKELTIEAAAESVIKEHTEQLKCELFRYINNNFK
jgi:hypothetical protein